MNRVSHPPLLNKPARQSAAPAIWSISLSSFAWVALLGLVRLFFLHKPAEDDKVMRLIVGATCLILFAALLTSVVLALIVLVRRRTGRIVAVISLILATSMLAILSLSVWRRASKAHTYAELPTDLGARAAAETARKSLTKFDGAIIDSHAQRYPNTCVPSSVEMVLKLLERVPLSYYDLQDQWKTDGSFQRFDGKTFNGVTFRLQFWLPRDDNFPLEKLFAVIRSELQEGRFVIVGLASGNGWHNWVIYDEDSNGEFLAVSKFDRKTIEERLVKAVITKMNGTDIGTYTLQAPTQ